jgi:formylglycine-generating enzyme required for sulfatase activity
MSDRSSRAETIINSIGIKLILVPAGTFTMGSPADEEGRNRDEELYEVTLTQPYYLGMTPVTQTQYGQVMGGNPSFFQAEKLEGCNSNHPVEQVSWDDAVAFCVRLSESAEEKAAGRVYRLPTEAEWEYPVGWVVRQRTAWKSVQKPWVFMLAWKRKATVKRNPLAKESRKPAVFLTCTGTFGSGALTGTDVIPHER